MLTRLLGCLGCVCFAPAAPGEEIDFAGQIRPILIEHCVRCHGADLSESNYRLDLRASALGSGDLGSPPIVRGDTAASPLLSYVRRQGDLVMPPEGEGQLSEAQVALLARWIRAGAPWPDAWAGSEGRPKTDQWAFQPVTRPPLPRGKFPRARRPLDTFVQSRLASAHLAPAPRAKKTPWLRRITLDMHGLPPTPAEQQAFLDDDSEDAYAKVVERILASPRYGERWARHWLDVVRFAESTGFEVNRDRERAYPFRDYVIAALNHDKPYRDFVIEQLAGDVVGVDVATGYLVGGPFDMVKSPDIKLTQMQRQDELADYVNTTGTAFLGLTIGCARCHNHKFDPISQRDYYAMQAVFAGVMHGEREIRGAASARAQAKIEAARARLAQLEQDLERYRERAQRQDPRRTDLLPAVVATQNVETFTPVLARAVRFRIQGTNSGEPCIDELEVFTGDTNVALASTGAVATASGTLPGYAIHKLEHIHDGRLGNHRSWISNTPGGGWVAIDWGSPRSIDRIVWGRDRTGRFRDRLATTYAIDVATEPDVWRPLVSSDRRETFGGSAELAFLAQLDAAPAAAARRLLGLRDEARQELKQLQASLPKAYIGTFQTPERIYRLFRGDPQAPREPVAPDALAVIGPLGLSEETPEAARRLALARWIASAKNPLTARVIVNRLWQYHFGKGLVGTPSDFGANGEKPSHPELLDHLAFGLMDHDWSLKWLHREILNSHTYQQSSRPRAAALAVDAGSRLLWRFPPRRLAAEAIRDSVLAVSGALNPKSGGPGFSLFEIHHENVHHYFPRKQFDGDAFRRMIYMTKIRQEQDDVFGLFDCPDGGQVAPQRSRSTTPLQALNLLNSPFMVGQAARMAGRIEREVGADPEAQVRRAFALAFLRTPSDVELAGGVTLVEAHGLEALCRALFNSNEFLFLS